VRTRGEAEALSKSLGSFTPADPLAGEELRAALADILRDTKAEEYTPDYYQATIDAAARDLQAGTTGALLHSESADHARQHAASIACLVLKNFADPEWCPPGVVRSMVGSLAWLIDQGEATQVARCERAISQQSRSGRAGSEIAHRVVDRALSRGRRRSAAACRRPWRRSGEHREIDGRERHELAAQPPRSRTDRGPRSAGRLAHGQRINRRAGDAL
jgi:hypothetical protein